MTTVLMRYYSIATGGMRSIKQDNAQNGTNAQLPREALFNEVNVRSRLPPPTDMSNIIA